MYGRITYTDVVNQVQQHGWKIISQTTDATVIEKRVGAPGIVVIPLSLVPIIGMILAVIWIAVSGNITVTIERKLTTARALTPRNEFDINTREDLDTFFSLHDYRRNVGYYPVVLVGVVVAFAIGIFIQLGPGVS